jgi:uncharacterized protein
VYLADTNIWLERLLDQDRSEEVGDFLQRVPGERIFLTDFTLHSIGIILIKLKNPDAYSIFIQDLVIDGAVQLVGLQPEDMTRVIEATGKYNLDFDDAYQYATAAKFDFEIVSFDSDFDRTDLKRKAPGDIEL